VCNLVTHIERGAQTEGSRIGCWGEYLSLTGTR